jgi:hypothetical protein
MSNAKGNFVFIYLYEIVNLFLKSLIAGMSSLMTSFVPVHALDICKGKRSINKHK